MKVHQLSAVLLFFTFGLLNLVLAERVRTLGLWWPGYSGVCGLALIFTEIGLLALWLVWGGWNLVARLGLTLPLVYLLANLAVNYVGPNQETNNWFGGLILCLILVLGPLLLQRVRGACLVTDTDQHAGPQRLTGWQFSIWGLMSLTTALTIILASLRYVDFRLESLLQMALFMIGVTTLSTLSIQFSLRSERFVLTLAALLSTAAVIGATIFYSGLVLKIVGH